MSAKSSSHFGVRRTLSGIDSVPSGRGYSERILSRRVVVHGRNEPSMLGIYVSHVMWALDDCADIRKYENTND